MSASESLLKTRLENGLWVLLKEIHSAPLISHWIWYRVGSRDERTGITGSTLTHHMKLLSAAGLVNQVKDGRRIICIAAAFERVQVMSEFLLKECCADSAKGKGGDHG